MCSQKLGRGARCGSTAQACTAGCSKEAEHLHQGGERETNLCTNPSDHPPSPGPRRLERESRLFVVTKAELGKPCLDSCFMLLLRVKVLPAIKKKKKSQSWPDRLCKYQNACVVLSHGAIGGATGGPGFVLCRLFCVWKHTED